MSRVETVIVIAVGAFVVAFVAAVVYAAIAEGNHGPRREGLTLSECAAWCGASGVAWWNRSHEKTVSVTSYDGKPGSTTQRVMMCECVGTVAP
jgi:hypothetical protein